MKKILFILILVFTVSEAKPCMTDIYFGNGVWNTRSQTIESTITLKKFMLYKAITRLDAQKEGVEYEFKYAYNPSYGKINDLIETFWQLKESGQISDGYFGAVYAALTWEEDTEFYNKLSEVISKYESDVDAMFTLYQTSSFSKRHNVLLVAHSQGNLFGNKMYTLMNEAEKKKFRMISVGTPADHVMKPNQTEPYVTLVQDPIITGLPDALPGNTDGFGHTFISAYLNDSINAPRKIALYVKSTYDDLMQTASCSTYDYIALFVYALDPKIRVSGKVSGVFKNETIAEIPITDYYTVSNMGECGSQYPPIFDHPALGSLNINDEATWLSPIYTADEAEMKKSSLLKYESLDGRCVTVSFDGELYETVYQALSAK